MSDPFKAARDIGTPFAASYDEESADGCGHTIYEGDEIGTVDGYLVCALCYEEATLT